MFTNKKKISSVSGSAKPENRLIRLFRTATSSQASLTSSEVTEREDAHNGYYGGLGNAMLEAEYGKAKAIIMMQQHRNLH